MAIAGVQDGSEFMLMAVGRAMGLPAQGKVEEAWEYIRSLRNSLPNAVTHLVASFVTFFRASRISGSERLDLHREQMQYFEEGWRAYQLLPAVRQEQPEMRVIMSICFDAASIALTRLGDDALARTMAEKAIGFKPNTAGPLTVRGILTYPGEAAVNDFRKAATLPNSGYVPFLYLAHQAFRGGRIAECERLCREALSRKPGRFVQAQLCGWIAVCHACHGADRDDVERLFQTALEIDRENEQVAANYQIFLDTPSLTQTAHTSHWNTQVVAESIVPDVVERALAYTHGIDGRAAVRDMLLAG